MAASQRPMGVTILAWLAILGGIVGLLNGGYLLSPIDGPPIVGLGLGQLILGVLNLIFGCGALALKPWAWSYGIGVQVLAIISNIIGLSEDFLISIIGIILNSLILYYLFTTSVKRVFGKA